MDKLVFIEFTRPKAPMKFLSWIIRLIEGTPYSHVRLSWINSVSVPIVYEASGTSVKFLGPLALEENPVIITHAYKCRLNREQYRALVKLCMENAGVSYKFKQLVGIALVKLFRLKKNPLSEGRKSQVCSEIVGRFLQMHSTVANDLNLDIASPKDIQYILDQSNHIYRKVK